MIGETDFTSALSTLHPKAIYMVEGKIFQVEELDFVGRKAHVKEVDCDYYTDGDHLHEGDDPRSLCRGRCRKVALHGEVHVVSRVVGFKKIRFQTNENVGSGELDLPEQQMHTTAYWLEVPAVHPQRAAVCVGRSARRDHRPGVCDEAGGPAAADVRCARHRPVGERRRDATATTRRASSSTTRIPAASASARRSGGMHADLLSKTSALITGCDCDNGCPMCVGPIGETGPLAKTVALRILQHLLAPSMTASRHRWRATASEEVPF